MMEYKTRQELFDNAYRGLKSQGFHRAGRRVGNSEFSDFACLYRGPNEAKCAIGWNIPDNNYSGSLESRGACDEAVMKAAGINPVDRHFASQLQGCHDHSNTPEEMKSSLEEFAERKELRIPSE